MNSGRGQPAGPAADGLPSLETLVGALPAPMRQPRFAPAGLPPRFASAIRHGGPGQEVDLSPLPDRMRQETAWCLFRIIEIGGTVAVPAVNMLARRLGEAVADHEDGRGQGLASLLDLPVREWSRRIAHAVHRRTGQLPAATTTRNTGSLLARMAGLLAVALDAGPWWRLDEWNPVEDSRIPLREHEPMGRYTVRFGQITTGWLRAGAQWHCKTGLETGTLTWSSVHHRLCSVRELDRFLAGRQVTGPALADGPAAVRALMLEFLTRLRTRPSARGRRAGKPLSAAAVARTAGDIEQFYAHMASSRDEAAAALGEPGWLALGPEHYGFYRRRELPVPERPPLEGQFISAAAMTQVMTGIALLGASAADGGYSDEQAMRITLLAALLGRRINEICMLDPDPLLPLLPLPGQSGPDRDDDGQVLTAKLRYQQTKIDGAPDTVPVHGEVVAIIAEQQQWAEAHAAACCTPGCRPKYLFLAAMMNRNGDRPYSDKTLRSLLTRLAARLGVRDDAGALIDFNRTHRFRHTAATSLLNAGVPLHVVQRYMGHLTPAMTMRYAQTLAETAEAEFLRFRKLTADARPVQADPKDLYDMLQLDSRTDRILPNGWCMLPPRQSCDRGNACLTCSKFATDATFLPELRAQKERTLTLIDSRQTAFTARTGTPMTPGNVWLDGRQREAGALGAIITALESSPEASQAAAGAGTAARADAAIARQDERNAR